MAASNGLWILTHHSDRTQITVAYIETYGIGCFYDGVEANVRCQTKVCPQTAEESIAMIHRGYN